LTWDVWPMRWQRAWAGADGLLLSFREGGDLLRCNATGREAQLLRLTDTVSDATLEVLRRDPGKAGHWTSSTAQLDLRVRGLLPFAGRNLYGPVFDPGDDDGKGLGARFRHPVGLALLGNAYDGLATCVIADAESHVLRTVTRDGTVTTAWGHPGAAGFQDGLKEAARFNRPGDLAVDGAGNVYVADTFNQTIRKITPAGVVVTMAGQPGTGGSADDLKHAEPGMSLRTNGSDSAINESASREEAYE